MELKRYSNFAIYISFYFSFSVSFAPSGIDKCESKSLYSNLTSCIENESDKIQESKMPAFKILGMQKVGANSVPSQIGGHSQYEVPLQSDSSSHREVPSSEKVQNEQLLTIADDVNNNFVNKSNGTRLYYCHVDEDKLNISRSKRYVLQGGKWKKLDLTWAILTPSQHSSVMTFVQDEFAKALQVWSKASKLTFRMVGKHDKDIDIKVGFHLDDHGDKYPFDGKGNTLAHAFYPGGGDIGGDVHFDDSEEFESHVVVTRDGKGTSLFITAAHEIGHSLGLRHSNEENSLMAPYYKEYGYDFELPYDDRIAIQSLYGRPEDIPPLRTKLFPPTTTSTTKRPWQPPISPTPRPTPPTRRPTLPTRRPTPPTRRPTPPTRLPSRPPDWPTYPTYSTTYWPIHPTYSPTYWPTQPPYSPTYWPIHPPYSPTYWPTQPPYSPTYWPTYPPLKPMEPTYTCTLKSPSDLGKPDICSSAFDAVSKFGQEIFFFKDEYLWRVDYSRHHRKFIQHRIEDMFHELKKFKIKKIDAAYSLADDQGLVLIVGQTLFILGMDATKTTQLNLKDINVIASHIDAAWTWGHNGHVYLISGEDYWRLGKDGKAQDDYPRDSTVWRGLPSNISAAFTYDTVTYFFSGNAFWPFDNRLMRAKEPSLVVASFWFGCPHYDPKQRRICSSATLATKITFLIFVSLIGQLLFWYNYVL